ncbi:GntR family transcriptional regulator [Pendulispora rubella]|uniref:GntR family transcriptional regulator n=1 Tax=Pendulispora rubella TaxID=2741070 RepID=A0ABZ2KXG3_9BACT
MTLRIRISPGSNTPIYRQIVDQVRMAVRLGVVVPGDPLPSVRALSEELVVNANTIAKAYAELCQDGTVESRAGRGMFVAPERPVWSAAERRLRFENALEEFLREAVFLRYSSQEIHRAIDERLGLLWGRAEKGKRK